MKVNYFYLKFLKKEKITKDIWRFYFNRVKSGSADQLDFFAGQYVHLYLPIQNDNGRGPSRMFTISSSPLEKDYIFITTKITQSLFKKTLLNLLDNSVCKFYGPSGSLVIDEIKKPQYIFLAGGIGITPFRSIIKYVSQKKLNIPITLIVSFSGAGDMLFYDELKEISENNSNIKVNYIIQRIDENIIKKNVENILEPLYYIVGPPGMVSSIENIVSQMVVPSEKIFIENFIGY